MRCCSSASAISHLVVEATLLVQEFEELHVCLTAPEVEVADFEVTPDYGASVRQQLHDLGERVRTVAAIVGLTVVVGDKAHGVPLHNKIGILGHEFCASA